MKKKNAGFTLIELAIVLVVIGLIIAAVLKGEDLIQDARMLNFTTNPIQKAETLAMTYYDRTGQYPGWVAATTPFSSGSSGTNTGALLAMYNAGINGVLTLHTPFTEGSTQLGIVLTTVDDGANNDNPYPAIAVIPVPVNGSKVTATNTSWTASDIAYADYVKAKLDGNTDSWSTGSVRFTSVSFALESRVNFTSLQSELNNSAITTAVDGYFTWVPIINLTGPNANYNTPTPGSTGTLLIFYSTQPH